MKNIKRLVSLITALAVVMSLGFSFTLPASAAEFSDVSQTASYAEAVGLLTSIGIIVGYEDGTFRPERTITRAEAAAVMVRAMGMESEAKHSAGATNYTDVPSNHWASGYVNVASAAGIIIGFPDGTFKPEENVTYEQIVKMVVCAIGHDVKAANGGYPQGYLKAAADAGVTKGIGGSVGQDASRLTVARLVFNSLEVEMMDEVSFSNGLLGTTYALNGKTILNDYLGLERVDAVVTDTYVAQDILDKRNKDVTLEITKVYGSTSHQNKAQYQVGNEYKFNEGMTDAAIYLGKAVSAYIGEDQNSGEDKVFAITLYSARNESVEITQSKFDVEESEKGIKNNRLYYLRRATDRNLTKLELARNYTVVVNGTIENADLSTYFDSFDLLTLVDNDHDGEYEFVFVSVFDDIEGVEFVVTDIDYDDDIYYFKGEGGDLEVDMQDDSVYYTVIRDGKGASFDDIEEDDVITCLDASKAIVTIYVSSESFRGTVESVDENEGEYEIGNRVYTLSPAFQGGLDAGDTGKFYINYLGKIAYSTVSSTVTSGDYVFITNYGTEKDFSKEVYKIQLVNAQGRVAAYTLKSKMKYITPDGVLTKSATADEVFEYLSSSKQNTDIGQMFGLDGYIGVAKVKVSSSGTISEVYLPGRYTEFYEQTKYASDNNREYSAKKKTYGIYDLSAGGIVAFNIDKSESSLTDAVEVGSVSEFFSDGDSYNFVAYGRRGKDIEAIVITDGIASIDYEAHATLVTKKSTVSVNGDRTIRLTGISNGQTVTYTIDPDENYDEIVPGNIILAEQNTNGYVSKLELVANTTSDERDLQNALAKGVVDVPTDSDAKVFAGIVNNKNSRSFTIEGLPDESFYSESKTAYYLTDYTLRETTYAKSSFSSAIRTSNSVDTFVVVRTYEDEVIDVFAFRIDAGSYKGSSGNVWDNVEDVEPEQPSSQATEPSSEATEPSSQATEPSSEATAPSEEPTPAATEPSSEATAPSEEPTPAATEPSSEATAPSEEPTPAATEPSSEATAPSEEPTPAATEPSSEAASTEDPTSNLAGATMPSEDYSIMLPTAPMGIEIATVPATEAATEPEIMLPTAPMGIEIATIPSTEAATEPEIMLPTAPTGIMIVVVPTQPTTEAPSEEAGEPTEPKTEVPVEPATEPATAATETIKTDAKLAQEVLALVNAERAKVGAPALTWDVKLAAAAQDYSVEMAKNGNFSHTGVNGSTFDKRLSAAGASFTAAGENIAKGQKTAATVMSFWMNSEGHKKNILSTNYTKMGVGVAYDKNGTPYWTQEFTN